MSKYLSITIPEGCTQDWNKMEQRTTGKHCDSCKKTVIDFTLMTDNQLTNFFKKNTGNVCGRFYDDQLNKQIAIPKGEFPWLKYFFTITLPAFLFSQKSWGQKISHKERTELVQGIYNAPEILCFAQKIPKDKKDSIINLDEVIVKTNVSTQKGKISLGGSVRVTRIVKRKNNNSDIQKENELINIFPNPISPNSKLTISWKEQVASNQFVEIFNANGNLIQKEMISISSKTKDSFIWLKQMPAGFYIIKITDAKTKIQVSKVFVVQ